MILTIGHTKGGVGKTLIAVQLALARSRAGRDVWLIDGDRQGTAQTTVAIRAEAERKPGLACAQYVDGATLRAQVQQQAARFEDVIIDAGGRDSSALRAALVLSDVLLVPFQPRSYDVWALGDVAALVDGAQEARAERGLPPLRVLAVLNGADPGGASSDNMDAIAALADYPGFEHVNAPIRRRKAFANAAGQGLAVEEATPRDPKACEEMAALVRIVFADQPAMKPTVG